MTKYLILGATGYIGSKVLEVIPNNSEVYLLARKVPNITKPFRYIPFDLQNPDLSVFKNFKLNSFVLINLAWTSLDEFYSSKHFDEAFKHFKLVEFLVKKGLKSIVYSGTCLEYGKREGCLTEDLDCKPDLPYALGKYNTYLMIKTLQRNYNFNLTWLRLFYIYGGNDPRKTLWNVYSNASKDNKSLILKSKGNQIRDYLHIDKISNYIWQLSKLNQNLGIVNICSGQKRTIIETLQIWNKITNSECIIKNGNSSLPDYEPNYFWGSNKKLSSLLNLK